MDPIFEPEEIDPLKRWNDLKDMPYFVCEPFPFSGSTPITKGDDDVTLPIMAGVAPLIVGLL